VRKQVLLLKSGLVCAAVMVASAVGAGYGATASAQAASTVQSHWADTIGAGYYSKEGEEKRQAVNRWIREGGAFDGVIDFDAVLQDPANPDHLAAQYDVGDHVHPNDAGYRKMGEAVDLVLLRKN
jgi:lysophospholipase L1-like esterase